MARRDLSRERADAAKVASLEEAKASKEREDAAVRACKDLRAGLDAVGVEMRECAVEAEQVAAAHQEEVARVTAEGDAARTERDAARSALSLSPQFIGCYVTNLVS